MNAETSEEFPGPQNEIADTDIIFECPHCAKSMAIDRRGAGLMISCPDCGTRIRVPYTDGLEIPSASVSGDPSLAIEPQTRDLAQALHQSREKVQQLIRLLDEARHRRITLEKMRLVEAGRLGKISDELAVIQSAIDRIAGLLEDAITEHADDGDGW